MDRQEVLLKEYEICAQHNNSVASQYWVIASIFVAVNVAAFGWIVNSRITENAPPPRDVSWLVLALGTGMIIIIVSLMAYFDRINFLISANYGRMHEIEAELGMWKGWRIHILDHWNELSDEQKIRFAYLRESYLTRRWWQFWKSFSYVPPVGRYSMKYIFYTLLASWIAIIVMAFVFSN